MISDISLSHTTVSTLGFKLHCHEGTDPRTDFLQLRKDWLV